MKYLSLFSGIEAATVAWHPIGWECVGVSEIEPFPCAVLAHHYPEVPNIGDVTKITEDDIKDLGHIDIVVFGSPCQDLSVAGLRKGFTCESTDTLTRSGLFFIAMRIVEWAKKHCGCRFALWENVPGAFSSSGGRDFATVVEHMAGLENVPVPPKGWGNEGVAAGSEGLVEWATLDAQWFGVAQRRRRVFALADFGDWSNRQPILLEPESLRRDSAPSRETGEEVTTTIISGAPNGSASHGQRSGDTQDELIVPVKTFDFQSSGEYGTGNVASTMSARDYKSAKDLAVTHSLRGEGFDASEDGTGRGTLLVPVAFSCKDYGADAGEISPTLRGMGHDGSHANAGGQVAIAFHPTQDPISSTDRSTHAMGCGSSGGQASVAVAYGIDEEQNAAEELMGCLKARTAGGGFEGAVAYGIRTANTSSNGWGIQEETTHTLDQAMGVAVAFAQNSRDEVRLMGGDGSIVGALAAEPGMKQTCYVAQSVALRGREGGATAELGDEVGNCLRASGGGADKAHVLAPSIGWSEELTPSIELAGTIQRGGDGGRHDGVMMPTMQVRRLTPVECARLQGFPDDYLSQVTWRGKSPPPDGPMYKALGNSMAVPVMAWIGRRIEEVIK